MKKKVTIYIKDGQMRVVYDDAIRPLMDIGNSRIERASHVEPGDPTRGQDPKKWYANITFDLNVMLGPFDERHEALEAELKWLDDHRLGFGDKHASNSKRKCKAPTTGKGH